MFSVATALSAPAQPATLPNWTIMVFMNGDNNLEPDALMNFRQMASVGGNKDVNVVVQFDRIGKYAHTQPDWTQTLRFVVTKGMHPLPAEATQDIGEADMGDPKVLSDFVKWARTNYPAQHYMLVIWDHGEGWRLFVASLLNKQRAAVHSRALPLTDSAQAQIASAATLRHGYGTADKNGMSAPLTSAPADGYRSASNDETDNDVLYDREIEDGLKDALQGAKLDVLAFDACLMSMVETGYAMRDSAKVLLASEELVPGPGWPYDDVLSAVEAQNPTDGAALAKIIVSAYKNRYQTIAPDTTFAAIDLSRISSIADRVSSLADALTPELRTNLQGIVSARDATSTYAPGYQFYHVDVREFMEQLKGRTSSASVLNAISAAEAEINSAVIANYAGADRQGPYGSFGLAIYFPATSANHVNDPYAEGGYEKDNTYYPVEFVQNFHWADFLHAYWIVVP
jgi:hypothetical protein